MGTCCEDSIWQDCSTAEVLSAHGQMGSMKHANTKMLIYETHRKIGVSEGLGAFHVFTDVLLTTFHSLTHVHVSLASYIPGSQVIWLQGFPL